MYCSSYLLPTCLSKLFPHSRPLTTTTTYHYFYLLLLLLLQLQQLPLTFSSKVQTSAQLSNDFCLFLLGHFAVGKFRSLCRELYMTELGHIYFRVQYDLRLFNGSSQNAYEVLNNLFNKVC